MSGVGRGEVVDAVKEPAGTLRIEPRWPVALAVLAVVFLLTVLPGRVRVLPIWFSYLMGIVVIVPMGIITMTTANARWERIERNVTLLFFLVTGVGTLTNLTHVIAAMVRRSEALGGNQLLSSSMAIWVTNVLMFSMLYWQIDRGGPEGRQNGAASRPDWLFPQTEAREDVPPDWRPTFVDYLFLGYSTATAFSPTDVLPLTSRAKLLMMLESAISLVTIVAVVSRAVNILGS